MGGGERRGEASTSEVNKSASLRLGPCLASSHGASRCRIAGPASRRLEYSRSEELDMPGEMIPRTCAQSPMPARVHLRYDMPLLRGGGGGWRTSS